MNAAAARHHAAGVNRRIAWAVARVAEIDASLRMSNSTYDATQRRLLCDERDTLNDYTHILSLQLKSLEPK